MKKLIQTSALLFFMVVTQRGWASAPDQPQDNNSDNGGYKVTAPNADSDASSTQIDAANQTMCVVMDPVSGQRTLISVLAKEDAQHANVGDTHINYTVDDSAMPEDLTIFPNSTISKYVSKDNLIQMSGAQNETRHFASGESSTKFNTILKGKFDLVAKRTDITQPNYIGTITGWYLIMNQDDIDANTRAFGGKSDANGKPVVIAAPICCQRAPEGMIDSSIPNFPDLKSCQLPPAPKPKAPVAPKSKPGKGASPAGASGHR